MSENVGTGESSSRLWRLARRVGVVVLGVPILLAGAVMLVTPGPGIAAILAGLAVLSIEFQWPRRQMHRLRDSARTALDRTHREEE